MKTTTIKELAQMVAKKVGLDYVPNTIQEFGDFIRDIYPQFNLNYESLDDLLYYTQNANVSDINITMPTDVLKAHFDEVNKAIGISESSCVDYFDNYNDEVYEEYDSVESENVDINIVEDNGYSVKQILANCHELCKKYNCAIKIEVGNSAYKNGYCEFNLIWNVDTDGIHGQDLYFSITDDNGANLMGGLYWLVEMFREDTVEDFEKFGIKLSYQEK